MKILIALCLVELLILSASGAEPKVITLGDNEKVGEVLVLATSQLVKLTTDQKSVQGLIKLAKDNESPVVYYDDAAGGALGFIGSNQVAFVTNRSIQTVSAMTQKEMEAILDAAKPMLYQDFAQKYSKNPPIPYPTVPIQVQPLLISLLLKDKPSTIILCKSLEELFTIEIVEIAQDKSSVRVKVHRKK